MFSGALFAVALIAQTAGPVAHPALTAAFSRTVTPETYADLARLADAGVPGARALYEGFGVLGLAGRGRDFPAACRAWESAAAVSAEAAHFTAECYQNGHAGVSDLPRAIELYRQAGEGGFPKSLCALGNMYMAGDGVPADPARAAALCRRGAEAGDIDAQTDLGNFYLAGKGVPQDTAEARRWYERAAAYNQRNAAFVLGQMYWNGDTVEKDNDEAVRLWLIAWEAGRKDAALLLARAYLVEGLRDPNNHDEEILRESAAWYDQAILEMTDPAERAEAEAQRDALRVVLAALDAN